MKIANQIFNRFSKTQAFKGLVNSYMQTPDNIVSKVIDSTVKEQLPVKLSEELMKEKALQTKEAMRYRVPTSWNSQADGDRKMYSNIPQSYLRQLSVNYPVARACINRRIRQITQLKFDITTVDSIDDEKGYETDIATVKQMLKQPMGHHTRMREMLSLLVDDVLTVDAVCFEIQKQRNGNFMHLVPVDPTTIVLRVTDTGGTPVPPEPAYAQFISGRKIDEFTTDEMIFESLNTRSYTPYGLAPLESLVLQVEAALRSALYNVNFLKEGTVPEGFINLPEDIAYSQDQIEEWQMWFDSLMAGDPRMVHRLKILPNGAAYTASKKPEDMAFEKFELWLAQLTCMVFDVQPQDIGITYQVNKATGETQSQIGDERGLYPLANFIKEIMDENIQDRMLFPQLQWVWSDIDPTNMKEEVEIFDKEVRVGAKSVDEYRVEHGLEPIGLGPYILTASGPIMVDDIKTGMYQERQNAVVQAVKDNQDSQNSDSQSQDQQQQDELKQWRKFIYNDIDKGREIRTDFKTKFIDADTKDLISSALKSVHSKAQAHQLFDQFLNPQIRASMKLLDLATKLRSVEDANIIN